MAEAFQDQMSRTHNTRPMMNARAVNLENLKDGVGVVLGFRVEPTDPISQKVKVSRGILVGPGGREIRIAVDPSLSATQYQKPLRSDFAELDLSGLIGSTLDPGVHAIMITVDSQTGSLKAHKITLAEQVDIDAAIAADGDAVSDFDAATGDHAARLRGTFKDPDTFAESAKVSTEYVIATAEIDGVGGDVDSVTDVSKERRQPFADMILP